MANDFDNLSGIAPKVRAFMEAQAKFNADDATVVATIANVTASATAEAWSYTVPFELRTTAGAIIPYTGDIAATAAESTSGGGTADPSDATPAVVMGKGTVNFVGTEATWSAEDTATLTLTLTTPYATEVTDTFVVTFA